MCTHFPVNLSLVWRPEQSTTTGRQNVQQICLLVVRATCVFNQGGLKELYKVTGAQATITSHQMLLIISFITIIKHTHTYTAKVWKVRPVTRCHIPKDVCRIRGTKSNLTVLVTLALSKYRILNYKFAKQCNRYKYKGEWPPCTDTLYQYRPNDKETVMSHVQMNLLTCSMNS